MFYLIFRQYPNIMMVLGATFVFLLTYYLTKRFMDKLPCDEGRAFAVEGQLSKGKPRGDGLIFILCFIAGILLFSPLFRLEVSYAVELIIYLLLVSAEMITGYLDDRSKNPWTRKKKALFDLIISLAIAITYVICNGGLIHFMDISFELPLWLLVILITLLCFVSINVTNCADGIDGLSSTLVIICLLSFLLADAQFNLLHGYKYLIIFFMAALLAYLWFNAGPSILMMGDAGSRAMGTFILIIALKSGHPLLFIPFALVIILDGGLGLFKITMIKITKNNNFLSKLRTPLHDHVRKNIEPGWSNNQCVTRFAIIQMVISALAIYVFCR